MSASNDEITRAQLVLRALGGGAEPYYQNVLPMAELLRDEGERLDVIGRLVELLVNAPPESRTFGYAVLALAGLHRDG